MSDVLRATLTGRVKKVFDFDGRQNLIVEVLRPGMKFTDNVTVWDVEGMFVAGDAVKFEGDVWGKVKVSEKNHRPYVDMWISNPKLLSLDGATVAPPSEPWPDAPIDDGFPSNAEEF